MLKNILRCCLLALVLKIVRISTGPIDSAAGDDPARHTKATEMLNYMDARVNPCDDFYEFTCGNWNKYYPAEKSPHLKTGLLQNLHTTLEDKLKVLLTKDEAADTAMDKKVKGFYRSCVSLWSQKRAYPAKVQAILAEFGEMPAMVGDQWRDQEFDWLETLAKISHTYGLGIITDASVNIDIADSSLNRLYIGEQELALGGKQIYLEEGNALFVKNFIIAIATKLHIFLGIEINSAIATANEILQFETALARGKPDPHVVQKITDLYTVTSLDAIQQNYGPYIDFRKLVILTFGFIPEFAVYVNTGYLDNLVSTLQVTEKRVVANYIFYYLLDKFLVDVPATEQQQQAACLKGMRQYFTKNFDNMIYRRYNTKETEHGVNLMWQDIKAAFKDSLESNQYHWIQPQTRQYALQKLQAMRMEIVSYEHYKFSPIFEHLQIDSQDYVANLKSYLTLDAAQTRSEIYDPPKPIDLSEKLSSTPAHILIENVVKVPVSMLQPYSAWSSSFPNAFNFGVLGALLSHELIHGFDDTGRHHDAKGNSADWWDPYSANDFTGRTKCFNEQYRNYVFKGEHLPDMPLQSENIADNGGVRLAYAAYLKWHANALAKNPASVRESMPGLSFSDKKLFFISYGQLWCGDIVASFSKLLASIDTHVPDKFRVIGPLSNFVEFSKEFQCPQGSGMNPISKCEIY